MRLSVRLKRLTRSALGARGALGPLAVSALLAHAAGAQAVVTCKVTGASGKCTPTVSLPAPATIVNPALLQLTVSPTSSSYTATSADMNVATGLATPSVISLTVMGNRSWTVQVNGNSAFWTASGGAWTSKPVADLVWSLTPAGARTAMTTTANTVTTGTPGPGAPVSMYVRPIVHWTTDKPGTYTMNVTFTLTSP
jgi:hypothetical protein